ncbi:MAG: triose-phosphate isomerase [Candidatus Woesearchaeota archaeon]
MKLKTPIIIINFKAYPESTGKKGLALAKKIEKAALKEKANVAIAVQSTDIQMISSNVKIPVLAQHTDIEKQGAHTGKITAEAIKQAGAIGTLINHSEYNISRGEVGEIIRRCKSLNLDTVVCAKNSDVAAKLSLFKPSFIAVEPPDLIGGEVSVTTANPKLISETVKKVYKTSEISVLCGAGVHTTEDVAISLSLGAKGVLVASGVVKNKSPYKETLSLIKGIKK